MQERHHLENQKIKILAQRCERRPATPRVERAESLEQVVDLVLERQFGEHTDRSGVTQSLLERGQVDDRGLFLPGGWWNGALSRWRRLGGLGRSRRRRLRLRRLGRLGLGRFGRFRRRRRCRRLFRCRRRLRRLRFRLLDGRGNSRSLPLLRRRRSFGARCLRFQPRTGTRLNKDEQEACRERAGAADRHCLLGLQSHAMRIAEFDCVRRYYELALGLQPIPNELQLLGVVLDYEDQLIRHDAPGS